MFFYKYVIFFIFSKINQSTPFCKEGTNFCKKCNPITKLCIQCEKDIYSPDTNGGCENARKCRIDNSNCIECSEKGDLCQTCDIGYFPDENGGCTLTENCEISYRGECLKCIENYILIGRDESDTPLTNKIKLCKPLSSDQFQHCIDIYTGLGMCNKCEEGYYLSYSDSKCTLIKNCAYSSYGNCLKCDYGYYFDKNSQKCLIQEGNFINCKISNDGIKCSECDDDTYFDSTGKCAWSKFCLEGERFHCNKCIEGYYLTVVNGVCTTEENCMSGRKDLGICTQCKDFYCIDFKDGKCKYNLDDNDYKYCKIASDIGCTECIGGYALSNDNKCTKTENCKNANKGNCTECNDNYYLGLDNKCTNVENCIYSDNNYNCIECKDNYFFNKFDNKCKFAEGKFENCKYGSEDNNCERCKNDFYLNQIDNLCYSNINNEKFNKCAISNGENCIECLESYFLGGKDKKCSKIEHCSVIENEEKCLFCDETYCADGKSGKCEFNFVILNEEKKFYYRCNRTNEEGTECEMCLDGYELKNGLCLDERHCNEKNEYGICKKCGKLEGENYEQCLNDIFGCIETMFYENCLECYGIDELGHCTKCFEGYEMNKYGFCE